MHFPVLSISSRLHHRREPDEGDQDKAVDKVHYHSRQPCKSRADMTGSQCVIALGDTTYGIIMLPIVLSFSRVLAAVATNLDRNPSLTRNSGILQAQDADATAGKVGFVEDAANVLREAFIKCLAGSPGVQRASRPTPEDKRVGIYLTANSALKLFMRSRRLRNAQQIFNSIDAQSPPLSFYPAAQRVTYLYYLGRYHFANNHFLRAQQAMQTAYDQCHRQAIKHRRLILIYLVATNMILGRFPSLALLSRPEAADIGLQFIPLCKIIRRGDLGLFHQYMDLNSESAQWFLKRSILFQLRNRCEVLVWRSLIRKCFLLVGYKGEEKKVPFLRLNAVLHAARWSLGRPNPSADFDAHQTKYIDPEFAGMDEAINDTGFDLDTGEYYDEYIGQYTPYDEEPTECPTMNEVESIVLSLIQQGFLRGFALHTNPRFAIPGSQNKGGPLKTGFPQAWGVIASKASGEPVPGWVEEQNLNGGVR
jgi:nuclear mRNA export protein PCID2/THP1